MRNPNDPNRILDTRPERWAGLIGGREPSKKPSKKVRREDAEPIGIDELISEVSQRIEGTE